MIPHLLVPLRWLDGNPFVTLAVPPFLILIQFLDMMLLFRGGLPESMADTHGKAAVCILKPARGAFPIPRSIPART